MAQTVRDVMTPSPLTVSSDSPIIEAARAMRDKDVGAVLVMQNDGKLCGIVTDRDIVVRALADGLDPENTPVSRICSQSIEQVSPDATVQEAVRIMREKAIRRIPVTQNGKPIGIVSLGDLAITQDPNSALGQISAAPPNN